MNWLFQFIFFDKYNMDETNILNELKKYNIWYRLEGQRYDGNFTYHNWYIIGLSEKYKFGELDFGKKPIWRITWYKNGKYHHDTGFIENNTNKLINKILDLCIPGIKLIKIDERLEAMKKDFD